MRAARTHAILVGGAVAAALFRHETIRYKRSLQRTHISERRRRVRGRTATFSSL